MRQVYDFLKQCGTFFLATVEGGKPHVRAFGAIDLFEDRIYFQTDRFKKVSEQLRADPKVEICAVNNGEWLRIEAIAVEDDRVEPRRHLLENYPSLKAKKGPEGGIMQVFYLKDATAVFSSFQSQSKTVHF